METASGRNRRIAARSLEKGLVVNVLCDASPAAGLGHLNRCLILAGELRRQGAQISFLESDAAPFARARIEAAGFETQADLSHGSCLIVDDYRVGPEQLAAFKPAASVLFVIDDEATREFPNVDVLLNQNPGAPVYPHAAGRTVLRGPRYALVRDEFVSRRHATPSDGARLLLTFGGADPLNAIMRVLQAVRQMEGWSAMVALVGPAYAHLETLQATAARDARVEVVIDPPDVSAVMAACSVAVTAAGSTCYELACMGIPFVTVVVASNQLPIARPLDAAGLAPCAGDADALIEVRLLRALEEVVSSRAARSARLRTLVDGRGAERVAGAILAAAGAGSIEPLDVDDPQLVQAAVALDAACVSEMAEAYSNEAWAAENFLRELPGKRDLSACAINNGVCTGFWVASLTSGGDCHTHRVAVDSRVRGEGTAWRLFAAVERRAGIVGARRMTLEVGRNNTRALGFYAKLGFEPLRATEIHAYLTARGRTADVFEGYLVEADRTAFAVMGRPL